LAQAATGFDGLKVFDQSLRSGTALQAVIVTASGKATETPLGIVTPSDIPGLVRAAEPEVAARGRAGPEAGKRRGN